MDTKILEKIGLTNGESKVYLALLEIGLSSTGQIIEKSQITSSKVYIILQKLEKKGLVISGVNPEQNLVEIAELKNHPFFLGTQFHPEFKARPLAPHPLFTAFIKACIKNKKIK